MYIGVYVVLLAQALPTTRPSPPQLFLLLIMMRVNQSSSCRRSLLEPNKKTNTITTLFVLDKVYRFIKIMSRKRSESAMSALMKMVGEDVDRTHH